MVMQCESNWSDGFGEEDEEHYIEYPDDTGW